MYDLVIIGAGPAGLTASIYASCFHLKHLIIGSIAGGQLQLAPDILNYPGFDSISGKELTTRMLEQAKIRGGELITQSVMRITSTGPAESAEVGLTFLRTSQNPPMLHRGQGGGSAQKASLPADSTMIASQFDSLNNGFEIETQDGKKYQAKAIILATGTERRKLNVPGEVEYTGKGVHYCATCEKLDYEGKTAAVVGGANSAVQAAVELAQAAAKVYIIYRGTELRGDPIWLEQIKSNDNIEVIYSSIISEIVGNGEKVTGIKIQATSANQAVSQNFAEVSKTFTAHLPNSPRTAGFEAVGVLEKLASPQNSLEVDKIFIEIGGVPGTALVIPLGVKMDQGGYIEVNERLATNVAGIFAAGDLVGYALSIEQISSAVGLGARAAASAFAYLKQDKAPILWGGSQIKR